MKLGECIIMRTWDSNNKNGEREICRKNMSTPHSAAFDPDAELSERMHPRRSVEIRMAFAVDF